jgi:glutamyl-tRNA synthetase
MKTIVRFAPSPTGLLHVGNIRKAIINFLFAKKEMGMFFLRLDNTDTARCSTYYVNSLIEDLNWMGLSFDKIIYQLDNICYYNRVIEFLKYSNAIYPCYESCEDLENSRRHQLNSNSSPLYNRRSFNLTNEDKARIESGGGSPHWRFKLSDYKVCWNDLLQGEKYFYLTGNVSDPVLIRENGIPTYLLTSILDDLKYNITHIIRGSDHLVNTAVQIQICHKLGFSTENILFAHLPLLMDFNGNKLSKRLKSFSLRDLKSTCIMPEVLFSYLLSLGKSSIVRSNLNIKNLLSSFNVASYGKSSPRFFKDEVFHSNTKHISTLDYSQFKENIFLKKNVAYYICNVELWFVVYSCSDIFNDINIITDNNSYVNFFSKKIFSRKEMFFLQVSHTIFKSSITTWSLRTSDIFVDYLKHITNKSLTTIFKILRFVFIGRNHGPKLKDIFYFLGYDSILFRMKFLGSHKKNDFTV